MVVGGGRGLAVAGGFTPKKAGGGGGGGKSFSHAKAGRGHKRFRVV